MRWKTHTQPWRSILFILLGLLLGGCGKPGDLANNLTNCVVTITSINGGEPFQSDVLTNGFASDDVITVQVNSQFRVPEGDPTAPDGPSLFDTITFHSYHVTHYRSDGGPNPASFTAGMNLVLAPTVKAASIWWWCGRLTSIGPRWKNYGTMAKSLPQPLSPYMALTATATTSPSAVPSRFHTPTLWMRKT
jgi:hypothetical protein